MSCYRKELITNDKGSYDGIIDMIYVLTMEKSKKRHQSIYSQLNKFKLTKNAKIMFNKGYKTCKKISCNKYECQQVKTPPHDITHAMNEIYKDAIDNNYKTILILEDDFIVSERINNNQVIMDIKKIINDYKHSELILKLGCLPFVTMPYNNEYRRVILSAGAHAVLYNDIAFRKIYNKKLFALDDYDALLNRHFLGRELMYKEPLMYQLVQESENMKYWDDWNGGLLNSGEWFFSLMKYLRIDKSVEPGTSLVYKYHGIANFLFFILMIIIIYYLGRILIGFVLPLKIMELKGKKKRRKMKGGAKNRRVSKNYCHYPL